MFRLLSISVFLGWTFLQAQQGTPFIYKEADGCLLEMEVCTPPPSENNTSQPAILFIQGGGWFNSDKSVFYNLATYFALQGYVTFSFDYRNREDHHATPFDALEDSKSAMRYIRKNAHVWNIDPTKIYAVGVSAGGHMAMASALIDGFEAKEEDLSISSRPDGVVLLNPVLDNGPQGYGYGRIKERYKEFSPFYNVKPQAPPTLILGGAMDPLAKPDMLIAFRKQMLDAGNRCELTLYPNTSHNMLMKFNASNYKPIINRIERFLKSM